jgi:hypothetical protein
MPKKLLQLSWKCYQALFSVVEQLKSMPDLSNECSRENYIKVKQESEPIMWDITYINIFINEPIRTMT